jgi:uncharacterized repeat protein (TIGR03803 family)
MIARASALQYERYFTLTANAAGPIIARLDDFAMGDSMRKFSSARVAFLVFSFCAAAAISSPAQTFTTLASFNSTGGYTPNSGLVQGFNGNFYGTTSQSDGTNGLGTVFEITASGSLSTLNSFDYSDGATPLAGLLQGRNGNFYGTANLGGTNGAGTVFEVTPTGTLTALYNFCSVVSSQGLCGDGGSPAAGLVQASNGNFYGTTDTGGDGAGVGGTVFEITPAGILTTLHSFCAQYPSCGTDGRQPRGLMQASNGNLYGVTTSGGTNSHGTIFEITPTGTLTTLYSFCSLANCADGTSPVALVQATNGNFYGTARMGGFYNNSSCNVYGCGTVFEITPAGKLTTLHTFLFSDGSEPAALVQATDGNFYGVAGVGTTLNFGGTIFKITAAGAFTTLHTFDFTDGAYPDALVQATDGNFYGTASAGGADQVGAAFSLSVGLRPFVKTLPTAGKVGAKVLILGNKLSGTTSVSFNGTAATFTVVSNTEIKVSVPTGATTGAVKVTTPGGTLSSNIRFRVTP